MKNSLTVLCIILLIIVTSLGIVAKTLPHAHSQYAIGSLAEFMRILIFNLAGTLVVSVTVFWLAWNNIIVKVFETKNISYVQALWLTVAFYLISAFQCLPGN
jgi:hypothetical protein